LRQWRGYDARDKAVSPPGLTPEQLTLCPPTE
jgi:hypothetical protein